MPAREAFAYALLRVIPDAERGEALNVGIVLFCTGRNFLKLRSAVSAEKLRALHSDVDVDAVAGHMRALELIAAADPQGGPMASGSASARFNWLVAPSSTLVQPSEVHTGLCTDPEETIERLFLQLVL